MSKVQKEVWKDIPNYEGYYQVSNLGRVKSLNYNRTGEERVLSTGVDGGGYSIVGLCKDGKAKTKKVHRLALLSFIGEY